ncbi:XRE family transcriptional regulator [Streptomyces sp. 8K308]|uniref:helix-turn-helix transcriptional regulator n=1 Tax=Streptomyces sp. 8K308 TaxID=2530388 RepID=UPI0010433D3B|nr:helix-turn-helix transcriptional regulator [Streptomyces sp. 8K308]TDC22267.1 XRE family transcriptional regulator [Streptomyces sp. 8K308]
MPQRSLQLGEFLRSRRARLSPEDAGLVNYGGRRRVPGLRREELAQLAGVSVAYYTRLEQGQSQQASGPVLEALARALKLNDAERAHLHSLARWEPPSRRRARPERLRPGVRLVIESVGTVPALVYGRRTDVLAWNRMGHALLGSHLDFGAPDDPAKRPNLARMVFLDPHLRELYPDWKAKARDAVADLRVTASRYQDDPQLTELIGELTMKSPEFAALWNAHPVRTCAHHQRTYQHPLVGRMVLGDETMRLPDDEGQRFAVFTAEPGSPSEAALRLLADLVAEESQPRKAAEVQR